MEERDKQQEAVSRVDSGDNIFITGSAGTGKTYVTKKVTTPSTIVVAPTGVAALNAGGSTAHKVFGLPLGLVTESDKHAISQKVYDLFNINSGVDRIILDEIGMLRRDYFELIDHKLRKIRKTDEPFGGIQVVGVGDFFQLEPIVSRQESGIFYDGYSSPYSFTSDSWVFDTIELDKVYRQEDERQVKILNSIRTGDKWSKLAIDRVNSECAEYENTEDTVHLCAYRKDVDKINNLWYHKLQGRELQYQSKISGYDQWKDSPVEHVVKLKVGTKVLICANDPQGQYVNGDRGTVTSLGYDHVEVELTNGHLVRVFYSTWEKYEYNNYGGSITKDVSSTFTQIPIKLAYAMTVHKMQGLTLDKACLHTGKGMFGKGQLYVGLSRIRDLKNLSLFNPLTYNDLKVSKEVQQFYRSINND